MWVDGVYVKAGLEREKAAILVVMAALSDGSKVVVSAVPGYRESTRSWSEVLRDLEGPWAQLPAAGGRGRTPGYLGSASQRLAGGGGTALLEPQDTECVRQAAEASA